MTSSKEGRPLHCPYEGAELNHHGNIIRDPIGVDEADQVDPALDGIPIEVHSCPVCGRAQVRPPKEVSWPG